MKDAMKKINLPNVTLIIVDCVDLIRAAKSFDHCRAHIEFGDAKILTHLDVNSNMFAKIDKLDNISGYSHFIVKQLSNYFSTDFVLVAQHDGFVWHPELWEDEFLKYDYIGAPWTPDTPMIGDHTNPPHFRVGNGGFSIRSKRLQDFLRDDNNIVLHRNEDVAICQLNRAYLEKCGFTFAPYSVAERFSLENGPLVPRFGCHGRIKLVDPVKDTLSVVMASFLGEYPGAATNREVKFRRAVNSFLNQNYGELVIVSDGCSITNQIVEEEFKHPNIKLVKLDKQPLFSGAVRNAGIESASGDWICYLDTDDEFGAHHLNNIRKNLNARYDWVFYDDYLPNGIKRDCLVSFARIGTSCIVHKKNLRARWSDGYNHDWYFIQSLGNNYSKINGAAYIVNHVPGHFDV